MKKQNDWYMEALNETLVMQEFKIDELQAQIAYLESGSKSEKNLQMIAELKNELAVELEDYESAKKYVESQKRYVA